MMQSSILAANVFGVGAAVFIGIFLAVVAAGAIAFQVIRKKVKKVSRSLFGTSDVKRIVDEFKQQEVEYENTPKSVSGMTKLLEPQIRRNYADFQWNNFRKQIEDTLKNYLTAWMKADAYRLGNATVRMQENLQSLIQKDADKGVELHITDIRFHQTELMNYTRMAGKDKISAQTSLECYFYKTQGNEVVQGSKQHKLQTRFSMDFLFVLDATATEFTDHAITECPNCGAPIVKVGMICEYCGSPVNPKSVERWLLDDVKQIM